MSPARKMGIWILVAAGLIAFASSALLIRFAFDALPEDSPHSGLSVAVWRTTFAVLLLLPLFRKNMKAEVARFDLRQWGTISIAGALLSLHFITWIISLSYTSVAEATVLVTSTPLMLAVLTVFVLREKLPLAGWLGVLLACAGAILLTLDGGVASEAPNRLLGNGLALFAAFSMSIYMLIGKSVRTKLSWAGYVLPLYSIVSFLIIVTALLFGAPLLGLPADFYLWCFAMAVGPQLLGHGTFNYALKYVSPLTLGLLTLLEPVGAILGAVLWFAEVPSWSAWVGIATTLVAVGFTLWVRHKANHA